MRTLALGICGDEESLKAYAFGLEYHLTSATTCMKARLNALMTRSHVADMVSNFAIRVLKRVPDTTKKCAFSDTNRQSKALKEAMQTACQLGLMGVNNTDRLPASTFQPSEITTKAQFITIVSRMLYGDKYNSKDMCRYCRHVAALRRAGIVTKTQDLFDPLRTGVAMLMLMRAQ